MSMACLFALFMNSCANEHIAKPINPIEELIGLRSGEPADINITMIANGQAFTDEISTIEVLAEFTNPNGSAANVDSLKIGRINIPQVGRTGLYRKIFGFEVDDINDALTLYGDDLDYDVYGSYPMPTFDESHYLPEIINFTLYDHGGEIDMTQNLTVTWNADASNDVVNIGLFYIPRGISIEDPVYKLYTTEDDGSFTIPSTDLDDFPAGYAVNIGIARGHIEDTELATGYVARLSGITYSLSEDIPMVD